MWSMGMSWVGGMAHSSCCGHRTGWQHRPAPAGAGVSEPPTFRSAPPGDGGATKCSQLTAYRSVIIDLTMFDSDGGDYDKHRRNFWDEAQQLLHLFQSLPMLEHVSFFADASDDGTLALLFQQLIDRDGPLNALHPPWSYQIKSFGWRQRAPPPRGMREYNCASPFVSTYKFLQNAPNLSLLVLDADQDTMESIDVVEAMQQLAMRQPLRGRTIAPLSLMICGPIKQWERMFDPMLEPGNDLKELFIDRPLDGRIYADLHPDDFITLVQPLKQLPKLQLLQVGSYTFGLYEQRIIANRLARLVPSLLVVGLLGDDADTTWWAIWRGLVGEPYVRPLGDGHLFLLEEKARELKPPTFDGIEEIVHSRRSSSCHNLAETRVNYVAEHTVKPIFDLPRPPASERLAETTVPLWSPPWTHQAYSFGSDAKELEDKRNHERLPTGISMGT